MNARQKITRARTALLLDAPWFGSLALKLRVEEHPELPTMATDGTMLGFNATWVESITDRELIAVIAHEVMHCAMLHPFRKGARDHFKWNLACDHAINPLLESSGFHLPAGCLNDPQYHGLEAEAIYSKLPKDQSGSGGPGDHWGLPGEVLPASKPGTGPGQGQPGTEGTPGQGTEVRTESDWQIDVEQATMVARKAGRMPAGIEQRIGDSRKESRQDWKAALRRFVVQTVASDYTWSKPNRRYMGDGLYLPGQEREGCPRIGVAVDTSGSVVYVPGLLDQFGAEIRAIQAEARPEEIEVVYVDSAVSRVDRFGPDEPMVLRPDGGGGTAFQPALDWFNRAENGPVACVIYLTDLDCYDQPLEPEYPVLWVAPISERPRLPGGFGELVRIDTNG